MAIRPLNRERTKWQIDYYPAGRKEDRKRPTFYGPESEARAYEIELRRQNTSINNFIINPKIIDVLPNWLDEYKINNKLSTYKDLKYALLKLIPHFGSFQFTRLSLTLFEQYKKKRLEDGVKKRTINREFAYFSGFVAWAVKNNHTNPLPFKIPKFNRVKSPKPIILHQSEIYALIQCVEEKYKLLVLLLCDGGLRRAEALNLKIEGILLSNGFIFIKGKGDKERFVPITTDRLRVALKKAVSTTTATKGHLFINPKTGKVYSIDIIRKVLKRAAKKANIKKKIYPHLLRHSFGTHAIHAGITLKALQEMLGHSSSSTTEIYTHLAGDFILEEASKFNKYIKQ